MTEVVGFVKEKPEGQVLGRPTKYLPEMCDKVVAWGKLGKSKTWMAGALGISRDTFNRWEHENEAFSDAITRAMALSQMWWEDAGQDALTNREFQSSVWSRSMGARFPDEWRESSKQEVSGPGGTPLVPVLNVTVGRDQSESSS